MCRFFKRYHSVIHVRHSNHAIFAVILLGPSSQTGNQTFKVKLLEHTGSQVVSGFHIGNHFVSVGVQRNFNVHATLYTVAHAVRDLW